MSTLTATTLVVVIVVLVLVILALTVQHGRERQRLLDGWAEERSRLYHLAFASSTPEVVALEGTATRAKLATARGRTPANEEADMLEPVGGIGGFG